MILTSISVLTYTNTNTSSTTYIYLLHLCARDRKLRIVFDHLLLFIVVFPKLMKTPLLLLCYCSYAMYCSYFDINLVSTFIKRTHHAPSSKLELSVDCSNCDSTYHLGSMQRRLGKPTHYSTYNHTVSTLNYANKLAKLCLGVGLFISVQSGSASVRNRM